MDLIEIIIIFIFAASLIANMLYVIFNRQMGKYTIRWDIFRWISAYQLFAYSPRYFRVYYRDKLENDEITAWQEVPLVIKWKWHHLIFFPENLVPDEVYSFVDDLVRLKELKKTTRAISKGFKYQTVLKHIQKFSISETSVARQFKIDEAIEFNPDPKLQKLFVSEFHKR